jgi:predicted cobalt transporter CbtA
MSEVTIPQAAERRVARSVAFILTVVLMLAAACLLVGVGFAFAFAETPEPPSTGSGPSWAKYVCWGLAGFTGIAALPAGLLAARLARR